MPRTPQKDVSRHAQPKDPSKLPQLASLIFSRKYFNKTSRSEDPHAKTKARLKDLLQARNGSHKLSTQSVSGSSISETVVAEQCSEFNAFMIDSNGTIGSTAMYFAARWDYSEMIDAELILDPNMIYTHNLNGVTPGHIAAQYGSMQVLQRLAQNKLALERIDNNGDTVMHYAARAGKIAVIRYLSLQHIDIMVENSEGKTCLDYLLMPLNDGSYFKIPDDLLLLMSTQWLNNARIAEKPLLYWLVESNRYDLVLLLLEKKGINLQLTDNKGNNLLHVAVIQQIKAHEQEVHFITRLIDLGVSAKHYNKQEKRPIDLALELCHAVSIAALYAKMRITKRDRDLLSALNLSRELRPVVTAYDARKRQEVLAYKEKLGDKRLLDKEKNISIGSKRESIKKRKVEFALEDVCDIIAATRSFGRRKRG